MKLDCRAGDRFDKLVAVRRIENDAGGNQRWRFVCDCGATITMRLSTAKYNVAHLDWCSCRECYFSAGGWEAISARGE